MLISTSKKNRILKMLIGVILTLVLCTSGLLIIQKPTQVSASGQVSATTQTTSVNEQTSASDQLPVSKATAGSSAVLAGNTAISGGYSGSTWLKKLASPVTRENIVSVRITTDYSRITGFTQGVNVKDSTSENDLYYYYKLAGYQVDTNNDDVIDTDGYDIVIYADVETIYAPVSCDSLFRNLTNCKSIIFDNFNTSNVTDMSYMFRDCSSLTSLNVSSFDTSKVTNMECMFYSCSSLTSLDVTNFDTSNVTNMSIMFDGCSSLTSLDVSNFDTSNVTDMSNMFDGCSSLTSLDVGNFDTSSAINMSYMFYECSSLTCLDLSSFDTSKVTNVREMFVGLQSLKTLNISNFSFSAETNTDGMFGMSDAQFGGMLGLEGDDLDNYLNLSFEEKVAFWYEMSGGEASEEEIRQTLSMCGDGPTTIIAPADLNGLEISLPRTYEYKDDSGNTISTDILVAGKTHTLANASTDTSETGVISDSILLSLIALCFVISGFMMLKKKRVR